MREPCAQLVERVDRLLRDHDPATTDRTGFLRAQFDHGLAWVHAAEGEGGLGLAPADQSYVDERLRDAGVPTIPLSSVIAVGMAAPTLLAHGTPEQRRGHLRTIFSCEQVWCQLFSEPGAGSDLAGVSTAAIRAADGWVVKGQKVWTSYGHLADWGLLLARTNPEAPKHRGLTYFIVDMKSPGVVVRPLYQMTGEAEFNEVYLDDVRIPDEHRVGDVGEGWRVALTTLTNERSALGSNADRHVDPLDDVLREWRAAGPADAGLLDDLMCLWVRGEVIRLVGQRAAERGARGEPGPEGSIGKLLWAEHLQQCTDFGMDLRGEDAALYPLGYPMSRAMDDGGERDARWLYLRSRAATIEGGTSDVLRNVIGERLLGLPPEPRVDKDVAWSRTLRG